MIHKSLKLVLMMRIRLRYISCRQEVMKVQSSRDFSRRPTTSAQHPSRLNTSIYPGRPRGSCWTQHLTIPQSTLEYLSGTLVDPVPQNTLADLPPQSILANPKPLMTQYFRIPSRPSTLGHPSDPSNWEYPRPKWTKQRTLDFHWTVKTGHGYRYDNRIEIYSFPWLDCLWSMV